MRRLVVIAAILALSWAGLWLAGSAVIGRAVDRAVATELASGRLGTPPRVRISGFPGRLDLFLDRIAYDDTEGGTQFLGTNLGGNVALWRPWHVSVTATGLQRLTLADGALTLGTDRLAASLALRPRPSLPLDLIEVTGSGLRISGPVGTIGIANGSASLGADPDRRADYAFSLVLHGISPDASLAEVLVMPGRDATDMRGTMVLDLDLTLSAPLDRHAGESQPRVLAAELPGLRLDLGDLHLTAQGRIVAGEDGRAEGRIDLHLGGWERLPDVLVRLGVIEERLAPTLARFLEAYATKQAKEGTTDGTLAITLRFRNGRVTLGPFPLGTAPRLVP